MTRNMLNDELWPKLKEIMLSHGVYNKQNLRITVEGILYRMRVGCPWRDLPSAFGPWSSVYQQFNRWSLKNKLDTIFHALIKEPDLEWECIDGSFVKAHQHSAGAASSSDQAIGTSHGGNTTKIHMVTDAYGLPIRFNLTGGQVHESKAVFTLLSDLPIATFIIADRGYDSEKLRMFIRRNMSTPVIPRKSNSIIGNADLDWSLYKYRHAVENLFARLKQFRALATRYDKLARNYSSMLALARGYLWLSM